ncbi:hypothetical protein ACVIF9_002460 [Bradyrhizobium sp. USDA 4350]
MALLNIARANGARIGAARNSAPGLDQCSGSDGFLLGFPEYRAQQVLHEFQRRLAVVVNEELDRTVIGKDVVHEASETQLETERTK